MGKAFGWCLLSALVILGCSTTSPEQRTQSAQKKYENARIGCWFQHGYDEAREAPPGTVLRTTAATGTTNSAIDVALRACLKKAQTDLDQELTAANAPDAG